MPDKQKPDQCQKVSYVSVQQWIENPAPSHDIYPKDGQETHAKRGAESRPGVWVNSELNSNFLHAHPGFLLQRCAESPISILSVSTRPYQPGSETRLTSASTASANLTRQCPRCQQALTNTFGIPPEWWSRYYQNSNGYFGFLEQQDVAGMPTIDTWARFQTKQERSHLNFDWEKIHVYTRRVPSLGRTVIVLFDMAPAVVERVTRALRDTDPAQHVDPLWVYVRVAEELASQADASIWAIRDHVRAIEKDLGPTEAAAATGDRNAPGGPDFRRLHDLARHAIHVTETLDVAVQTLEAVLAQHKELMRLATAATPAGQDHDDDNADNRGAVWKAVQQRLLAPKQLLDNQRCRAQANQARLQNEIQLAFNSVALQDSRASVAIGRAAQVDSAAMKTISLLTLIFLPPTFTCAIFSMSFFNYDAGGAGWSVSPRFWLYWAVAVPLTLVSAVVCYFWQSAFSPPPPPPALRRPREPSFPASWLPA